MKRALSIVLTVLFLCVGAWCTTVTSVTKIVGPDGQPFNGTITLQLPFAGVNSSTNQLILATPVVASVINGTITQPFAVTGNDLMSPAMPYSALYTDVSGNPVTRQLYYITGATFDVGSAPATPNFLNSTITFANNITATGNVSVGGTLGAGSVNNIQFPAHGSNSSSSTGGIQEAINSLVGLQGLVYIDKNSIATSAISMTANVDVRCASRSITITFTGATNGFVWPNTAHRGGLYGCTLLTSNAAGGKAIDIEDIASAATNVPIEDVKIGVTGSGNWAYGLFMKNALLNRFTRLEIQNAAIGIHGEGISNSNDFTNLNITNQATNPLMVEWQGGWATFNGGEIEGGNNGPLVDITQPGAAISYLVFHGTSFENSIGTGSGIRANTGTFECHGCNFAIDGAAGPTAFIIGNSSTTRYCRVFGGQGTGFTLGANASRNTVEGYLYSGFVFTDSSSAGSNWVFDNNFATDTSYGANTVPETPRFTKGIDLVGGQTILNMTNFTESGNITTHGFVRLATNNVLPALQFFNNSSSIVGQLFNSTGGYHWATSAFIADTNLGFGSGGTLDGFSDLGSTKTITFAGSSGLNTKYGTQTTAGQGLPPILGVQTFTAQTADHAAASIIASATAGEYRVCATARTSSSGTGTTSTLNILWTDEGGAKTDAVGTWALNSVTVTGQINKCDFIHAAAASAIQCSTSGGTYGTSQYALSCTAERIN